MQPPATPFSCAALIREIGRGARGARSLTRDEARTLYGAILAGRVSDLELGAVLLAYRMKGESAQELAGMLDAAHEAMTPLSSPGATPVVIPSYNGARKRPNLVPLLAMLLARAGVPVLMHGVATDPGRVTTAQILAELGVPAAGSLGQASALLGSERLAFIAIETLAPALAGQLALRARLGVRNCAHTIVKMLQPFQQGSLRLVNYTHAAYRETLCDAFSLPGAAGAAGVLLSRGTEGEAVADVALPREVEWLQEESVRTVLVPAADKSLARTVLPDMPDAPATAAWISAVLHGDAETPAAIAAQVQAIRHALDTAGGGSA